MISPLRIHWMLTISLFLLCPYPHWGQLSGKIVDSISNAPVPFTNVWIKHKNIGATSDSNGSFTISEVHPDDTLIVSAIGYRKFKLPVSNFSGILSIVPVDQKLNVVAVDAARNDDPLVLGKFKKSKARGGYGCTTTPWILAKYFDGGSYANQPAYIQEIRILGSGYVKGATMALRFFFKDSTGMPGESFHHEKIIINIRKGTSINRVDLSAHNIQVPKNGFFIGLEWMCIESNRIITEYKNKETGEKNSFIRHAPSISMQLTTPEYTYQYVLGEWSSFHIRPRIPKDRLKGVPCIEVDLVSSQVRKEY